MNVKFDGTISAQAVAGEVVTITVTFPDLTTESFTTQTLADKTFTATRQYMIAGTYKAKAHMDSDAIYKAWDSSEITFTIGLSDRTGTFTVTIP